MECAPPRWPTYAVLAIGIALRIALGIALPPACAYDDHLPPIEIITHQHRLPRPDECWECYQPPLYYAVAGASFAAAEKVATTAGVTPPRVQSAARKTVQFISVIAGCLTLVVCIPIVRRLAVPVPWIEPLAIAVVAVLPQHLYMSAMVTNDALSHLVATLAIWATLRAQLTAWSAARSALAGALAGTAVLCKGYGLVTAASVIGVSGVFMMWNRRHRLYFEAEVGPANSVAPANSQCKEPPRPILTTFAVIVGACATIGIWPAARNLSLYGKPHVDNFDFFETPMQAQPPGSRARLDFSSFRLGALLRRPWLHVSQVNSVWTELYARYWFDYEGLSMTLRLSPEWRRHTADLHLARGIKPTLDDWNRMLHWDADAVPEPMRRVAIASYLAGLPITAAIAAGLLLALRRLTRDFYTSLLVSHLLLCFMVPLVQVLRAPYFSSMKSAFTLSALSSVPVLISLLLARLPPRLAQPLAAILCLCLVTLAVCDTALVAWVCGRAG